MRPLLRRLTKEIQIHWREWLLFTVPFAVFLSILLAIGPYLQHFGYSALEQGAPSLAESQSGGRALLPSLATWSSNFVSGPFLPIGLLSAVIGLRASSPLQISIYSAACMCIAVSVFDIGVGIWEENFTADAVTRNLIANVVGGALFVLACSAALVLYEYVLNDIGDNIAFQYIAAVCLPILGLLISTSLFYILYFFVQPNDLKLEFQASPSFSGYFYAETNASRVSSALATDSSRPFSFLPDKIANGWARTEAAKGRQAVSWRSLSPEREFAADVYFLTDCWSMRFTENFRDVRPHLTFQSVKNINLSWDEGLSALEISPISQAQFRFAHTTPTIYWVSKRAGSDRLSISQFFDKSSVFRVKSAEGFAFFMRASLSEVDDGVTTPKARTLEVVVDAMRQEIRFPARRMIEVDRRRSCQLAQLEHDLEPTDGAATLPGSIGGFMIRLRPIARPISRVRPFSSELTATRFGGWANVGNVDPAQLADHHLGRISFFSVQNLDSLQVDGSKIDVSSRDTLSLFGKVDVEFGEKGRIIGAGMTHFAWLGDRLLNQTKWEKLSPEWRLALLGWIGGMLLLTLKVLGPLFQRLKSKEPLKRLPRIE